MILGIEILCDSCGTELETTDVTGDLLLKVTIKTCPCKKCSRPSDCQLSCKDVLDREKELITFREQVAKLEKNVIDSNARELTHKQTIGVLQEKIKTLTTLMPIEDDEDDEDLNKPECFGTYDHSRKKCFNKCKLPSLCISKKHGYPV